MPIIPRRPQLLLLLMMLQQQLLPSAAGLPNIVAITADDWGWSNFAPHRAVPTPEVLTPRMAALAAEGILLERHYAFMYCSPSRSAFHSGRNPVHVNVWNDDLRVHNASEREWGQGGIPRSMTGLAAKLAGAGYIGHHVGKWHGGLAHPFSTPVGRGFATSFGYLGAVNDYFNMAAWDQCPGEPLTQDLWAANATAAGPSFRNLNARACTARSQNTTGCVYEEFLFRDHVLDLIAAHNGSQPLFLNYAPHLVHSPLEAPPEYLVRFAFIPDPERAAYAAMVNMLDDVVGDVADALKARGLWNNTLLLVWSDNGGPIYLNGTSGANNFPLKGGKVSNWEGGVRTNAFLSGGLVPAELRGSVHDDLVACWDWYASFCALAGVDPADAAAAAAGLPAVDGVDQLPYIFNRSSTPPRTMVELGVPITPGLNLPPFAYDLAQGAVYVGGLVTKDWKLLLGAQFESIWTSPTYPNGSIWHDLAFDCGGGLPFPGAAPPGPAPGGCLFNMQDDPTEHSNLADVHPDIVAALSASIAEAQKKVIAYLHGQVDPAACAAAWNSTRKGVLGPWLAD